MPMMNITLHTDSEITKQAQQLFESLGFDLQTAVDVFLRQSVQQQGLPFVLTKSAMPEGGFNMPSEEIAKYEREAIKGKPHPGRWEGKVRMSNDFVAPVVDISEYKQGVEKRPREEMFDCLRGQVWMADDFDAPLEDFAEYM
jgi:DNA-damage-inducible protein J